MAPSWAPKSSPNREKIDAKIDQKIDACQDRFLMGFWWILGGKMEASWHQDGVENRTYLEKAAKQGMLIKPMDFQ